MDGWKEEITLKRVWMQFLWLQQELCMYISSTQVIKLDRLYTNPCKEPGHQQVWHWLSFSRQQSNSSTFQGLCEPWVRSNKTMDLHPTKKVKHFSRQQSNSSTFQGLCEPWVWSYKTMDLHPTCRRHPWMLFWLIPVTLVSAGNSEVNEVKVGMSCSFPTRGPIALAAIMRVLYTGLEAHLKINIQKKMKWNMYENRLHKTQQWLIFH